MGYKLAIIGATGNVGRETLQILHERHFPVSEVVALASEKSVGSQVSFGDDQTLTVQELTKYDFKGVDIVLSSAGDKVAAEHAPRAAKAGAIVIDNAPHFRMDPDVPLVVPEVNPEAIAGFTRRGIIACPDSATTQLVLALNPLHRAAKITRLVVSTYQAVSGSGKEAMDELFRQTRAVYVNDPIEKTVFSKQIAFNVIPQVDAFMDDGVTRAEWQIVAETKKILDKSIKVTATCVRVPVFIGHGEAVNVAFENPITVEEARSLIKQQRGCSVVDLRADEGYVTPVELAGEDNVYVSRIREDVTLENGLNMWIVGDNLRKGAALNAVQIAEKLIKDFMKDKS